MAQCKNCGSVLPDGAAFCSSCGASQAPAGKRCPICGAEALPEAFFCGRCGNSLNAPPVVQPVPAAPYPPQPPRMQTVQPPAPPQTPFPPPQPLYPRTVGASTGGLTVYAIICLLFLCTPAGIVALVYVSKANSAATPQEAQAMVKRGFLACNIGLIVMVVLVAVFIAAAFLA